MKFVLLIIVPLAAFACAGPLRTQRSVRIVERSGAMFPRVKYNYMTQNAVLISRFTQLYLGISQEGGEPPKIVTKETYSRDDKDLQFAIYYYDVAEFKESKLILPMHKATGYFLHMTSDRRLALKSPSDLDNTVEGQLDPPKIERADDRFFYLKSSGQGEPTDVLEAMNGVDYGYVLSLQGREKSLELHPTAPNTTQFPEHAMFQIIEPEH